MILLDLVPVYVAQSDHGQTCVLPSALGLKGRALVTGAGISGSAQSQQTHCVTLSRLGHAPLRSRTNARQAGQTSPNLTAGACWSWSGSEALGTKTLCRAVSVGFSMLPGPRTRLLQCIIKDGRHLKAGEFS